MQVRMNVLYGAISNTMTDVGATTTSSMGAVDSGNQKENILWIDNNVNVCFKTYIGLQDLHGQGP